jgi:arginine decarboxylase
MRHARTVDDPDRIELDVLGAEVLEEAPALAEQDRDQVDSSRESTSASALLLSSIDGARRQFMREGAELLDRAVRSAKLLRERLAAEVPELRVISAQEPASRPGVTGVDPTHVLIETAPIGLTGFQADDWLLDERSIDIELVDHRRIVALVTFAHGEEDVNRLVRALRDLVDEKGGGEGTPVRPLPSRRELRTEQAMLPRDAFFSAPETVKPGEAAGRVSAEYITPYPPGIPALAPAELVTDAIVDYLEEIVANGAFVEGAADPTLGSYRVVAAQCRFAREAIVAAGVLGRLLLPRCDSDGA